MWDDQMIKPFNQVKPIYSIYQPYLMKYVREKYFLAAHTAVVSYFESSVILYVQMCLKNSKSQLNSTTKYSSKDQET